ncbi:MAG: aminotransferase class IV [Phycisphaerae bacterium]|nr:aminotransferase class IV [Phycisphaerae bacterium]
MDVWLNGAWVSRADAKVSAFDAGLQHGVGLFETMLARNGRVFRARDHIERLATSARELRLTEAIRVEPLIQAVQATIERSGLREARVRLTITGGDLNLLQARGERPSHDPTILIVAQPPTAYPDALFTNGVRVGVAADRANPFDRTSGHKTLWYWPRLATLQEAGSRGLSEVLIFALDGRLASGCVSNAFLVKDGVVRTPFARGEAPDAPTLPGITRQTIIECCDDLGLAVERGGISFDDLRGAQECFLTNSSWGVLPVVGIEGTPIGAGTVGNETTRLRQAWRERVERETTS